MGIPNIPKEISTDINIDRQGIIDLLLISIALEEISLSHIINAESEMMKLYLQDVKRHDSKCKKEDFIKFNRSVSETLRIILEKEKTLKDKLIQVLHFYEDIEE